MTWLSVANGTLALSGIALSIIIDRGGGAEGLGVFTQAFGLYSIAAALATFGLANGTVRFAAESRSDPEELSQVWTSHALLAFLTSAPLALALVTMATQIPRLFASSEVANATAVILLSLPCYVVNRVLLAFENGLHDIKATAKLRTFRAIGLVIAVAIFITFTADLIAAMFAFLVVELLVSCVLLARQARYLTLRPSRAWLRRSLKLGASNLLSELVTYSQERFDVVLLGYFLSSKDVGLFSFASMAARGLLILPAAFMQNFDPLVARLWRERKFDEIRAQAHKTQVACTAIMLPTILLAIGVYALSVTPVMGQEYEQTIWIFGLLGVGIATMTTIVWSGGMLAMTGFLQANFLRTSSILVAGLVLNLLLVPALGLQGAAWAAFLHMLATVGIHRYFIKRHIGLDLLRYA